jgi:hypothetical protein
MDKSKLRIIILAFLAEHKAGGNANDTADKILALTDSYYLGLIPDKKQQTTHDLKNEVWFDGYNQAIDELRNRIGRSDG